MKIGQGMRRGIYGTAGMVLTLLPVVASAQWFHAGDPRSPLYRNTGLSRAPISLLIFVFMRWLLYLVGFLGVVAFVISGILYLTSAGDDDRIDRAKTTMIYAIIGVIVALMGVIIINAVDTWLGGRTAVF